MARLGSAVASGLLFLGMATASAQPVTLSTNIGDALHDGWYFNEHPYISAEARIHGSGSAAFAIDCDGTATRIFVDFRSGPPPITLNGYSNERSSTEPARITFSFVKHSFASALTSSLDTKEEKSVAAKLLTTSSVTGGPSTTERIIINGAAVLQILPLLKTMDEVSASVPELGQPISFRLTNAATAIDQLLPVCAAGS